MYFVPVRIFPDTGSSLNLSAKQDVKMATKESKISRNGNKFELERVDSVWKKAL